MWGCHMFTHMASDSVATTEDSIDADVMAAIEDGGVERLVIADVSRDEAYLTLPLADAACLTAWR